MYTETSRIQPVTETPLSLCDSMQLMLLQSWGNKIRVFPAVPEAWKNTAFDGLLAAGGFKVSASRKAGVTQFVTVESMAGSPCRVQTDIPEPKIYINGSAATKNQVDAGEGGVYEIALKKGDTVTLAPVPLNEADLAIGPAPVDESDRNPFGLQKEE